MTTSEVFERQRAFEPCTRPLSMRRTRAHSQTGEMFQDSIPLRCSTRRKEDCEPCSQIWRDDAFHVLSEGALSASSLTFITFTAPGSAFFGKTHTASYKGLPSERCACKSIHDPSHHLLGIPLDVDSFEYDKVAHFNNVASRLTAITMQKLWRIVAREAGVEIKDARLPTARVMEWQSRGLVHVHVLVQGFVSEDAVFAAVRGREAEDGRRTIKPAESQGFTWGNQVVVKHVTNNDRGRLAAYLTKVVTYAVKDVTNSAKFGDPAIAHVHRAELEDAGEKTVRCFDKQSRASCKHGWTEKTVSIGKVKHRIEIGGRPQRLCRRHKRARNQFGFTGNVLTLNRSWGVTLADAKRERAEWVKEQMKGSPVSDLLHISWDGLERTAPAVRLEFVKKSVTQTKVSELKETYCVPTQRAHSSSQHTNRVLRT